MIVLRGSPPRTVLARLRALRAFSLPVSVGPALVATAAAAPFRQWHGWALAACVVGVGLLHLAGNLLNDYFDFRCGVDRRVGGDARRPGRLLVRGELRPGDYLCQALACLLLAVAPTAYLTWLRGPIALAFAAVAVVALYAYTGPPFRLKYRALGEPLVFAVFGPALMAAAAYVQTGAVQARVLLLSIPIGLTTVAILTGNNVRDRAEDAAAGIRTLGTLAGGRPARGLYFVLTIAGAGGVSALAGAGLAPRVLLAAPVLLVLLARPYAAVWRDRRLADIDARTARYESVLLAALLVAHVLA